MINFTSAEKNLHNVQMTMQHHKTHINMT